jgi:hypothetical protein
MIDHQPGTYPADKDLWVQFLEAVVDTLITTFQIFFISTTVIAKS